MRTVPVHRQRRWKRQQELPVPGDQGVAQEKTLLPWLEKMKTLGTAVSASVSPAVVIGGTSAEFAVETAKLASTHYLDELPTGAPPMGTPSASSIRGEGVELSQQTGIGASSGASTSATTCASGGCRGTGQVVPWRWPCRAVPIGRPSERSRATECSSKSSRPILLTTFPTWWTSTSTATVLPSISIDRWTRSAPN
jgi:hypothetical protein